MVYCTIAVLVYWYVGVCGVGVLVCWHLSTTSDTLADRLLISFRNLAVS